VAAKQAVGTGGEREAEAQAGKGKPVAVTPSARRANTRWRPHRPSPRLRTAHGPCNEACAAKMAPTAVYAYREGA